MTRPLTEPRHTPFLLKKATYNEHIMVFRPFISLIGEDRDQTIINHNKAQGDATVKALKEGFTADNLTIINSFDYFANRAKPDSDPTKVASQARARFFEYGSTGPGAIKSDSRRVLTDEEAKEYTIENVLSGWIPSVVKKIKGKHLKTTE
jgi:pectin methylesterase-like acyl-CoA thioesterase